MGKKNEDGDVEQRETFETSEKGESGVEHVARNRRLQSSTGLFKKGLSSACCRDKALRLWAIMALGWGSGLHTGGAHVHPPRFVELQPPSSSFLLPSPVDVACGSLVDVRIFFNFLLLVTPSFAWLIDRSA